MFRKLKEKIADEVKHNPRLQASLDSVNQIASQTYSAFNKEGSGSRESLTSLTSQLSQIDQPAKGTLSNSSSTGQFFSLGEDDEPISLSAANSPEKTITPNNQNTDNLGMATSSTPTMTGRGRRLSSSSLDASLFPIYEDPGNESIPLFSDLESTAGSEVGWDDSSAQLSAVSKEQLYGMLAKMRTRYHKYKGRYADLAKAYRQIQAENEKVKEVMQQTQDKALRRISELREQCSLEKQAKQHLEEELRAELEEKQHVIATLNTKVGILKQGLEPPLGDSIIAATSGASLSSPVATLIDLSVDSGLPEEGKSVQQANGVPGHDSDQAGEGEAAITGSNSLLSVDTDTSGVTSAEGEVVCDDAEKINMQAVKIKRLESILTKCKEHIKSNKQKIGALTDVKEQLGTQLQEKEQELTALLAKNKQLDEQLELAQAREQGEEIQIAETKLAMHKELLEKDEQMGELKKSLTGEMADRAKAEAELNQLRAESQRVELDLRAEIEQMSKAQTTMELRLEDERKTAMEELSRGKEAALEHERNRLHLLHKKEVERELTRQEEDLSKRLREVEEEGRLGKEELELRLSALSVREGQQGQQIVELQAEKVSLQQQITEQRSQIEAIKEKQQGVKAEKIILEEKLCKQSQQLDFLQGKIDSQTNAEISLKEDFAAVKETIKQKESALVAVQSDLQAALANVDEYKAKLARADENLNTAMEEKAKEITDLLETVTKSEEEVRIVRAKLDEADNRRKEESSEHVQRLKTLEAELEKVASAGTDEEAAFNSRLSIMQASYNTELGEKEAEINRLNEQTDGLRQACQELEERLKYNLESSLKSEEEMEARAKGLEEQLEKQQENNRMLVNLEQAKSDLEARIAALLTDLEGKAKVDSQLADIKTHEQELLAIIEQNKIELSDLTNRLESKAKMEQETFDKVGKLESEIVKMEADLTSKNDTLSKANTKLDDAKVRLQKMHKLEEQAKFLESELDKRIVELKKKDETEKNLRQQLEDLGNAHRNETEVLQRHAEDSNTQRSSLDKELQSLKDQLNSRHALQDQMVNYEKELQSRVSILETEKTSMESALRAMEEEKLLAIDEVATLKRTNREEVEALKQDLEMKIRLEREKETSYKDLQKQSIEYEKRLQDQLEEKNIRIDQLNREMETNHKDNVRSVESLKKEIAAQQSKVTGLSQSLKQRQTEIRNLGEKREQLEALLEQKEKLHNQMEADSAKVNQQLAQQQEQLHQQIDSLQQLETVNRGLTEQLNTDAEASKALQMELDKLRTDMEVKVGQTDQLRTDIQAKLVKSEAEVKKLSKSRDRLKSLLDEKEKLVSDLVAEKDKIFGSQEQITSETNERIKGLTEKLTDLSNRNETIEEESTKLREEVDSWRLENNSLTEQLSQRSDEMNTLQGQLVSLQVEKEQLGQDRDALRDELNALEQSYCEVETEKSRLELEQSGGQKLEAELNRTSSELEEKTAEVEQLKGSLQQLQELSSYSQLKEENAILSEKISQYEEKYHNQFSDPSEDLQTLKENHSLEVMKLKKKLSLLEQELDEWKRSGLDDISDETEQKLKVLIRDWERKLALKEAEHSQELEVLREQQEQELARVQKEHRTLVNRLSEEMRDKETEIDRLHDQNTMGSNQPLVSTRERELAGQLEELQEQLTYLRREAEKRSGGGNSDWGWDDSEEMMHMTEDSPAIFGVPNHTPHSTVNSGSASGRNGNNTHHQHHLVSSSSANHNHSKQTLEESPEFEYLKNILYEYMMGHQPLILSKVLSAIVKFSPDQVNAIMKAEERKQSYLSSIGLS